ncbi:MAG: VWA domain-containing protein [Clostridia bacterium]|nr:VWA domain-containing protein [Clostridia bacterium]
MRKLRRTAILLTLIFTFSIFCPKYKAKSFAISTIIGMVIGLGAAATAIASLIFLANKEETEDDNLIEQPDGQDEPQKTDKDLEKEALNDRKKPTEIVFILDESGSMWHLKKSTISSFNEMLESQKNLDTKFPAYLTTVVFSDNMKKICDHKEIHEVENMTSENYNPNGCTALMDTLGKTINEMSEINKDNDKNVIFIIITDGYENASREFKREDIKKMIEAKREMGWNFIFFGANIDSNKEAGSLGIDKKYTSNFAATKEGMRDCIGICNNMICCML